MCNCKNVKTGSYLNQVELLAPIWSSRSTICVDTCLHNEILDLWKRGIKTTGCCCGHNEMPPFIGVSEEFIPKMKELGYVVAINPSAPYREDSFYPKATLYSPQEAWDISARHLRDYYLKEGRYKDDKTYEYFVTYNLFGDPNYQKACGSIGVSRSARILSTEDIKEISEYILKLDGNKGYTDCIITNFILLE